VGKTANQTAVSATTGPAAGAGVKPSTPLKTTATIAGPEAGSKPTAAPPASQGNTSAMPSANKTTPPAAGTPGTGSKSSIPNAATSGTPATGSPAKGSVNKPEASATKPSVPGPVPVAVPSAKTTGASKTADPATKTAPVSVGAEKPAVSESNETVDPEKFKQDLKKALGKIEPAGPEGSKKTVATAQTAPPTLPVTKPGENDFQEQLKRALDPAKSLTDSGEAADVDDIDTELLAEDDESDTFDTSYASTGGAFMPVSSSRKVIRYHSEGRRDPFTPLVGREGFSSKKRRAVPAAEQLRLVGILRSLAGNKALFEDGEGNGYILAPGDRVRNGYMVSVAENKVLFQVNEYGWTKTVAMELVSTE
jgi:hypothetical protein